MSKKIFKTGADELEGDSVSEKGGGEYKFITLGTPKDDNLVLILGYYCRINRFNIVVF
jgi:hypothetical protein